MIRALELRSQGLWLYRGLVCFSRKPPKLFSLEKPFVKMKTTHFTMLLDKKYLPYSTVSCLKKTICLQDIVLIIVPQIDPESFGTLEKFMHAWSLTLCCFLRQETLPHIVAPGTYCWL